MTTLLDDPQVSCGEEIGRLVKAVREFGQPDPYEGKRASKRYYDRMQLEVTTDPSCPSSAWPVSMHNVCEHGLAFWSKHNVPPGRLVFVREFSSDQPYGWIPARVRHSQAGIRGYIIGTAFEPGSPLP